MNDEYFRQQTYYEISQCIAVGLHQHRQISTAIAIIVCYYLLNQVTE